MMLGVTVQSSKKSHVHKALVQDKLKTLACKYASCLVVEIGNVGSNHMQVIRRAIRGQDAVILCGKNTQLLRAAKEVSDIPGIAALMPFIRGNVALIWTNGDLSSLAKDVQGMGVNASVKAGVVAPTSVDLPAMKTDLDPARTAFFGAMGIATKITQGKIEILSPVCLVKAGERVSVSAAALLAALDIRPFVYGMRVIVGIQNGALVPAAILGASDKNVFEALFAAVRNVASTSLTIGVTTSASAAFTTIQSTTTAPPSNNTLREKKGGNEDDGNVSDDDGFGFSLFDETSTAGNARAPAVAATAQATATNDDDDGDNNAFAFTLFD